MDNMKIDCPECLNVNNCRISIKDGKCQNFDIDKIQYWQHKYYRSILLPSITDAMGELSSQYVHDFILKPRWLFDTTGQAFYQYEKYVDIPVKFQNSAKIWQLDNGNFAVIPSMSKFTIAESRSFIKFCEQILYIDLSGHILKDLQDEAKRIRGKIK